jgi:DNA-binding CsgD family transcriptional regulator
MYGAAAPPEARDRIFDVTGKARAEGMLDAFEWLGYGAILVSRGGHVIDLNPEARKHVGSSIQVVGGQLTARDRDAKLRLQEFIAGIAVGRSKHDAAPSAVVLPRPSGRRVVALMASTPAALRQGIPDLGGIILLLDPNNQREPAESLLQQAFGFTPAEIRLATGLAKDQDLRSIAEHHNVSVGTLRVQLKSIFAKTNTKRQGQLLTLLAQMSLRPQ